ncbi:MAG: flavoprotein, partial [Chloroflexi bacterium]
MEQQALPIAIIGAGPVGLAAAAHALQRGLTPLILEQDDQPAGHIQHWSHVRVFSPWRFNIDAAARGLLHETAWDEPDPDHYPTGAELIEDYLAPLAQHPRVAAHLHLNTRVVSVSRLGFDKLKSHGREQAPFVLTTESADGETRQFLASA